MSPAGTLWNYEEALPPDDVVPQMHIRDREPTTAMLCALVGGGYGWGGSD